MSTRISSLLIAAGLVFAAACAQADTPPISPGLWQVHSEREINGVKAPDPMALMQNLPPELRQEMEAKLKQRGVDISGTAGSGDLKVCLSKESLDSGRWQNTGGNCKTTYTSRTAKRWAWRSVCTTPAMAADGEARFTDSRHYVVETKMKMNAAGAARTMHMLMTSTWLGADCGDVQPVGSGTMQSAQ